MLHYDTTGLADSLRKIRWVPFLGNLLFASRLKPKAIVLILIATAITLVVSAASGLLLGYSSQQESSAGAKIAFGVIVAFMALPPFLILRAAWGVSRIEAILQRDNLGEFQEWMGAFFGKASRLPMQVPSSWMLRALLVIAAALSVFLAVVGMLVLLLALIGLSLLGFLIGTVIIALQQYAWNYFRRMVAVPSEKILLRDSRSPILFLRSFNDDALKAKPGFFQVGRVSRFEEELAVEFWREGPVVAIGKPGETLPAFGACREYHTDDTWQGRVLELIEKSKAVAMLVGLTEALGWEISQLRANAALQKSVFIVPPLSATQTHQRLERFWQHMSFDPASNVKHSKSIRCITFDQQSNPMVFTSRRSTALDYGVAIHYALRLLPSSTPATQSGREGQISKVLSRVALLGLPVFLPSALSIVFLAFLSLLFIRLVLVPSVGTMRDASPQGVTAPEVAAQASETTTWTGRQTPYRFTTKGAWTELPTEDFDILLHDQGGTIFVGIVVEGVLEGSATPTIEQIVESIPIFLEQGGAQNAKTTALAPGLVRGATWLRTQSHATVEGIPFAYVHSFHYGPSATYTVITWTFEGLLDTSLPQMLEIADSFEPPED